MSTWESAACGAIAPLEEGDQVYVQAEWYEGSIKTGSWGDNKFTGFMLK